MAKKGKIRLSLAVREKMMRGQFDEAVELLMLEYKEYGLEKDFAERFIARYRDDLRERKVELEVLRMQHESQQEEAEEKQKYVRYAAWIVIGLVFVALAWLLAKYMMNLKS